MDKTSPVAAEYAERREREIAKAVRKYGDTALLPAGHPELDVIDYAINELVGFARYAEILEARFKMIEQLIRRREVGRIARDGIGQARQLFAMSGQRAFDLIEIRQQLKAQGLHLGRTEGA